MYLKAIDRHDSLLNEYGTLDLVRSHTIVPVPRPIDLVSDTTGSYLLTSRLPGKPLGLCIDIMIDEQMSILVKDLVCCLKQLRSIPKTVSPEFEITDTLGNACHDARVNAANEYDPERGDFIGPFATKKDFNDVLRAYHLPEVVHREGHRIVLRHGDLNMRNILIENGRFSGIVDWEMSGWYPEYWDYTKAHFITKYKWRWLKAVDEVFAELGDYSTELEIERKLWWYCF
ncbi:Uu.00g139220.m01.CDS01 [Anthostomella pinea]|uniref:Uu.00g139220.m01.CDS01 n=1 Tax=Anthostomella pinea TaxID=933095 RepID=A0AAI8YIV4_9PEZI|nr:Uu.00g139220.m01.CDS01 [Anthostomella pinea]